jgi:transketolase
LPYGGTFLVFSDYARNAVRMAALMKIRSVFVYTHDSIGLGEDGPTHQPIEHLASLRMIPNMSLWRPCDAVESLVAWQAAIERSDGPTCLIFSRQNLPHQARDAERLAGIRRGGYVLRDCKGTPEAIIIATGSEVGLAVAAAEKLDGKRVRVVSMPSTDVFDAQDQAYRDSVLPPKVRARIAVEAGVPDGWLKYVGLEGRVLGMTSFGESAPAPALYEHFGITPERIVEAVQTVLR